MGLNLYCGGCGPFQTYVVAESDTDAKEKLGVKLDKDFLPMEAEIIDEVDGYVIVPTTVSPARHCKKCDFSCDSQGKLLEHYRTAHPKKEG